MTDKVLNPAKDDISKYNLRKKAEIIIRNKNGKFLICLPLPEKPFHTFPGGGIEEGDDVITAATREALEEVGVAVKNAKVLEHQRVFISNIKPGERHNWDGSHTFYVTADYAGLDDSLKGSEGDARDFQFMTLREALTAFGSKKGNIFAEARMEILMHLSK